MKETIEKISDADVVLVSDAENEKITRVRADDDSGSGNAEIPSVEEFLKKMKESGNGENPLFQMADNMMEIKKIRPFFLISILLGFFGLFFAREYLGIAAIVFGIADLYLGSRLTQKAAQIGILLGLIDLVIFFS